MRPKRPSLFERYCFETSSLFGGTKRRRLTRKELAEANRLWWKHKDIRRGF